MIRKHPLLAFITLTFAWSWAIWVSVLYALGSASEEEAVFILPWILVGAYGPSVAAIVVTATIHGGTGVRTLLRKFLLWRVGVRWYLFAFLAPSVYVGIGLAIYSSMGGEIGGLSLSAWPLVFVYLLSAIPTGALAEELGWRGFLLPRLRTRNGAASASLIVGAIWFCWHIPLFWSPTGTTVSGQPVTLLPVAAYASFVIGMSFLFTWLHENTKGSVLMAVVFHASLNAVIPFVFFPDIVSSTAGGSLGEAIRSAIHYAILPIGLTVVAILTIYGFNQFSKEKHTPISSDP